MPYNKSNLPYRYENEDDPQTLANGVKKQRLWVYTVEQSAQLKMGDTYFPLIVEQMRCKVRYTFSDYQVTYAVIHEWQYLDKDDEPENDLMRGYRQYQQGTLLKADKPFLFPEVAVLLGFTPERDVLPAYVEFASLEDVEHLLYNAVVDMRDTSPLNAWMKPPLAAPPCAPEDISRTMSHMRQNVGITTTRGRGKLLRSVMETTGVMVTEAGWVLTPEEHTRRKAFAIED